MTAIVGLVDGGRVYLGGDSAITTGWTRTISVQPKVGRTGPYVYGYAGSPRAAQVLIHACDWPAPAGDLDQFMATTLIDAIRDSLKAGGAATKDDDGQERNGESDLLIGVGGRLFHIDCYYAISENTHGFAAIGSGHAFALGALHATGSQPPKARIRTALEAAARFSIGVDGPFHIVSVGCSSTA